MRHLLTLCAIGLGAMAPVALAQSPPAGPYKVVQTAKSGGDGGFDYVYADVVGRRLYIPRPGQNNARISVFDLDSLAPVGEIPNTNARGVAVDAKSGHAFASSKPVAMWDAKTMAPIKTIEVMGGPDGILADPFNQRIYILSHAQPNATVIDAASGAVMGTIDLGGEPEQAVTDGRGHLYIALENKDQIAAVDARALTVTGHFNLEGKCGGPAGLAFDIKHHVLFAACRNPATVTMLNSDTGKILASLPIGIGVDGATFNPATGEAFTTQGDGTLTVIKELSPTSFVVEQTVQTKVGAKTLALDAKTGRVLTMSADFGPPPPATTPPPPGAPPGFRRRGPMIADSFSILAVGK